MSDLELSKAHKAPVHTPKSILVTGGTGTFGTAFVQFLLAQTKVERICIYSRGEHAQAAACEAFGNDPRVRYWVGDIRDESRLARACRGIDTIVHAAALKRIETGANNPDEMVKTNVLGTMNVIEAAIASGTVRQVVYLSSDKAFQPVSPYGQTKALAESLVLAANRQFGGRNQIKFGCTRYGNIWNAQGSVVPKWLGLIRAGKPINLTDYECTRFFMTIDEAVNMVWQMCIGMKGGEVVIPDWLPAYRLGDLGAVFSALHGADVKFIGLPEFEKMHESMNDKLCSETARRMTFDELEALVKAL